MGYDRFRRKFAIAGSLTIGGDVVLSRSAANTLTLATGDTLDLSGTPTRLRIPNSIGTTTGTPALSADGQLCMVSSTVGQVPKLFIRQNGTIYWFSAAGSVAA